MTTQKPIGAPHMPDSLEMLSRQLQERAERLGLDTVQTEALMEWASTEMASHSPNIYRPQAMLIHGLRDSSWITNNKEIRRAVIRAVLHVQPGIRYAAVIEKPGKAAKVIAYVGSY